MYKKYLKWFLYFVIAVAAICALFSSQQNRIYLGVVIAISLNIIYWMDAIKDPQSIVFSVNRLGFWSWQKKITQAIVLSIATIIYFIYIVFWIVSGGW